MTGQDNTGEYRLLGTCGSWNFIRECCVTRLVGHT